MPNPLRPPPRRVIVVVGAASLANGVALVLHILGGLPMPVLLVVAWTIAAASVATIAVVSGSRARSFIARSVGVGVVAGLAATLLYDASKALLSQLDPSPYDPFEVARVFGRILLGDGATGAAVTAAGWTLHLANGITFGVTFAAVFGRDGQISRRRALSTGLAWALFLEVFQLMLYPEWLGIQFVNEFRQISFLAHGVFGLALGLFVPAGLRFARAHGRAPIEEAGHEAPT